MSKKLSVAWVVENFLPNYEELVRNTRLFTDDYEDETLDEFEERVFPEALSELLKAQRTMCQDVFDSSYKAEQVEDVYFNRRIENATIPEPKNRK